MIHKHCNHSAGLGLLCDHCGEVLRREDLISQPQEAYAAERQARREAFKNK